MSAVTAVRPLRRRSLERTGMTPEQELELLVAEQQKDDTYYVDRHPGEISLDARGPGGTGSTISDYVGVDEEGDLVIFGAPRGSLRRVLGATPSFADPRSITHGTIYSYRRLGCKCSPCRAAQAKAVSEYRANRRAES